MHILHPDHWTHSQLNLVATWRDVLFKCEAGQKPSINSIEKIMEWNPSSAAASSSDVQISTSFFDYLKFLDVEGNDDAEKRCTWKKPRKSKASWTMAKKCWNKGLMEYSEELTRKESMSYNVCTPWRASSYAKLGKSPLIQVLTRKNPQKIPVDRC